MTFSWKSQRETRDDNGGESVSNNGLKSSGQATPEKGGNDDSSRTQISGLISPKIARRSGSGKPLVVKEKLMTRAGFRSLRQGRKRSNSAPAKPDRHRLLEDHYLVDNSERVVLPGVPKHGDDLHRDVHDYFNLIILVPVVVLNMMNWNWDILMNSKTKAAKDAWTGEWWQAFFWVSVSYFVVDLIWILAIPSAVRSPTTIVQHHIATLFYLVAPYLRPETQWIMGACMSVEVNTWFLIARRVFNKQGFPPWIIDLPPFFSIRVKLISVFFYVTWISIRCIFYPYLLIELVAIWERETLKVGSKLNMMTLVVPLHSVFCLLNFKWTYDLIMSKIRWWRKKGTKPRDVSKGL